MPEARRNSRERLATVQGFSGFEPRRQSPSVTTTISTNRKATMQTNNDYDRATSIIHKIGEARVVPAPTRENFVQHRRKGMGGTDSGITTGVSPWGTLFSLYADKVSKAPDEGASKLRFEVGHALEPFVVEKACEKLSKQFSGPVSVISRSVYVQSVRNEIMLGSLDAFIDLDGEVAIMDAKTTSKPPDSIPPQYWVQLQHYMGVCGVKYAVLSTLSFESMTIDNQVITFDPEAYEMILDSDLRFWKEHVVSRIAPPRDPDKAMIETKALLRLYPDADDTKLVRLPDEMHDLFLRYQELKGKSKKIDQELDAIKLTLTEHIEDAAYGIFNNGDAFSYKTTHQDGYYVGPKTYRTFRETSVENVMKNVQKANRTRAKKAIH
jgi:predicted phage-related endonuclease